MKKLIALLIVAGFLLPGIVGCGGSATTKSATPPAADKMGDKDKMADKDKDKK